VKNILPALLLGILLTNCAPPPKTLTIPPSPAIKNTATTFPKSNGIWISPAVPEKLRQDAQTWGLPLASESSTAAVSLDFHPGMEGKGSSWIYALVVPFPTVLDGLTNAELHQVWIGSYTGRNAGRPLQMAESTFAAFTELWGPSGTGAVETLPADELLDNAWNNLPSWAIVPFESLDPRWKVLTIDGQSPIQNDFDPSRYPLQVFFTLWETGITNPAIIMPETNRDANKLTTVIMTGTTALVRWIAYKMEINGVDYPDGDIGNWLRQADILHVSNEVSFDPSCPPPNPYESRFYCSDPKYLQLLLDAGVDVVELTGNHNMDNGAGSALYSLDLYKEHHLQVFGGGADLADSRKPLLLEDHGNKIAFIGCNEAGPPEAWATTNSPGANPCDYSQFLIQISQLRNAGYLVITTYQYREGYSPEAMPWQLNDFRNAASAGASIVSGSQSHFPLAMEFYNGTFIHYGLGNLFFDQMGNISPGPGLPLMPGERREFLDRHVFYDGRYISTELLTSILEDYSRPRPMTMYERAAFLQEYFEHSGWIPFVATPAPELTPTLIPLPPFKRLPTHTPLPKTIPTP
jgi:poly-gamma-glutamate synthesis protein (capsule biosynthesis protein)